MNFCSLLSPFTSLSCSAAINEQLAKGSSGNKCRPDHPHTSNLWPQKSLRKASEKHVLVPPGFLWRADAFVTKGLKMMLRKLSQLGLTKSAVVPTGWAQQAQLWLDSVVWAWPGSPWLWGTALADTCCSPAPLCLLWGFSQLSLRFPPWCVCVYVSIYEKIKQKVHIAQHNEYQRHNGYPWKCSRPCCHGALSNLV